MSRFARVTEEVLRRHKELAVEHYKTGKVGRSAHETFYLYLIILCHSWATGYLEMPFADLCRLYDLEYHNSTRRLKTLREKGWIEKKGKQIRPLLIHRPTEKSSDSKSVTVTSGDKKSVTITPSQDRKSVTVTPEKCNSYTKTNQNGVTVTTENAATHDEISDSGDAKTFKDLKNINEITTTNGSSDKFLSEFSLEECLAWVNLRIENGEEIETPERLARWARRTGESDAFIYAALYPDGLDQSGRPVPRRLLPEQRSKYLKELRTLSDEEFDVDWWQAQFTPTDWRWLMAEMEKVEK